MRVCVCVCVSESSHTYFCKSICLQEINIATTFCGACQANPK